MAKATKQSKTTTKAAQTSEPVDDGLVGGRPEDRKPTIPNTAAKSTKKKT